MVADMLCAPHQDRNSIATCQHATIDADVHHIGRRILGDHASIGENVAAAVEPVPMRHRKVVQVDVFAGDDVFLHRSGFDDPRRNAAIETGAADLHEFARVRVGREPQHHGNAPIARQAVGEDPAAAAVRFVIILDVVEQQRRAGARALRQSRDGAKLDIPVNLGVDLLKFAGGLQRGDPAAKISKGNRLSLHGHSVLLAFLSSGRC